ncbi:hypothetical protein DTL42_19840 [Bremerella cremea]|uniref:Uncharacterized protein n=1 Tax=Bremerella cremea TaxID=1031537 RepID=A0A368KNW6_9BACT|nr:hypothetical protein [Bremerella cremea]RCS42083.1 hypothetical protein DTL42_19840 [Bremerella cremea]
MRQFFLAFTIGIGGFFLANALATWVAEQFANLAPFTPLQLYGIALMGPLMFVLLMFRKVSGEEISVLWGAELSLVAVLSLAWVASWIPNFGIATTIAFMLISLYPTARNAGSRCFRLAPKV